MAPFEAVDIATAAFKRDPFLTFRSWRENKPVIRVRLSGPLRPADEAYLLPRYADVSRLLRDTRFVKEPANAGLKSPAVPGFLRPLMRNMLALDDPDHGRLKRLVQSAFTPRRIDALEAQISRVSLDLIAKLQRKGGGDLIADYALPLPVAVISLLLGIPPQDQARFARWSGAFIRAGASNIASVLALPEMLAFLRYLRKLIEAKRHRPEDDLVSALVSISDDGSLTGEELMAMIAILLNAGHETTTSLIGNGWLALTSDEASVERLRDELSLAASAVEELLRMVGPAMTTTPRYASADIEIAGATIPRGAAVFGLIASANRDESQFPDPDQLDLARTPNRHLAFGEGGHYCIGAALARAEAQTAFQHLLTELPHAKLACDPAELQFRPGLVLRGPTKLPITC